jgi:hypothetical protein
LELLLPWNAELEQTAKKVGQIDQEQADRFKGAYA